MKKFYIVPLLITVVLAATGCTRSLPVNYTSGVDLPKSTKTAQVGIARFNDKRAWVEADDDKTQSFIASQGLWRFGMGYSGKEYYPVSSFIQEVLVSEFSNSGIKAKALSEVVRAGDTEKIRALATQNNVEYVVSGEILSFEFANEAGLVTVTSKRTVTLLINLARNDGTEVIGQSVVNESQREDEGLGVMHSTNVDKLVNKIFKSSIKTVIQRVSEKLSVAPKNINVVLNVDGRAYSVSFDGDQAILRSTIKAG